MLREHELVPELLSGPPSGGILAGAFSRMLVNNALSDGHPGASRYSVR